MARATITVQKLLAKGGQEVTFQSVDTVNLMQVRNTGVEVVLVRTSGAGSAVSVKFPSVKDPFDRFGDVGPVAIGAEKQYAFGPFTPPTIWGDGASFLFIDPSGVSGTATIAVVSI